MRRANFDVKIAKQCKSLQKIYFCLVLSRTQNLSMINPALVPWGQYDPRLFDRLNIPNV